MSPRLPALVLAAGLGLSGCSPSGSRDGTGASHATHSMGHAAPAAAPAGTGVERVHYVAAEEVRWDYAPRGKDMVTGRPFDATADVFVRPGPDRVGSVYRKCVYRAYADQTFTRALPRPRDDAYLGLLGPVIHAEVGDTIRVVFRNRCSFPTGMHPHGVRYDKAGEGAPYADGSSAGQRADEAVPTGGTYTYRWQVPERAGPARMDVSSVMWMYHGHTDEVRDTYTGLMGPIVVTARGKARPDGSPKDVDRELFHEFVVMDENQSHYAEQARRELAEPPAEDDEEYAESNLMHAVNGYVYGNGPVPTLHKGQRVRWYVMAMGTEVDLHTPHWHGNTVVANGMRMDTVSLLPATMVTADMRPDADGTWLFHCHVNDHILAGMQAFYRVTG